MIRIAIVEDQEQERTALLDKIKRYQDENHVEFEISVFQDGMDFIQNYRCDQDVILMDIDMPKLNGFDTAIKVREKDENVILIFITNLQSYVYKGYQVGAMDYILKPVHYPDLSMRLKACEKKLSKKTENSLVINSKTGMEKIPVSEIVYLESVGHDIILHLLDKDITYRGPSMKELEKELVPNGFYRSNHCYIVNLRYCEKIEGNTLIIKGKPLEISRSKKSGFVTELSEYFK